MNMYNEALAMKDTLTADRRHFHQNPELGLELPKTAAYVEEKLREMGYEPQRMGSGVVAVAGKKPGKCFLIRGDMDALPVTEMTDLEFKSENGCMHACGHDCHTANMLGAARLLKAHEDELEGQVKLMFQPAEETMDGAKMMVENGILKDPDVNAALGIHVFTNLPLPAGTVIMTGADSKMAAVDWFTIKITGKGCHGAQPNNGVDPLNVMSHIHLALQAINAREGQYGPYHRPDARRKHLQRDPPGGHDVRNHPHIKKYHPGNGKDPYGRHRKHCGCRLQRRGPCGIWKRLSCLIP